MLFFPCNVHDNNRPLQRLANDDNGIANQFDSLPICRLFAVHLMMVKIPDKGKQDVKGAVMRNSKLIAESGSYRHAFTTTDRVKLQVGCYVLAVSNYHQGETGTFDLKICSDKPVQVAVIQ
mmetsp:Transcript_6882/g.20200  ORF Transcript_6882/g.20200 Transcript_6882/m.20200 type:complete len:121 (+) Transcript_6882:2532-2894(+)